jgi:Protein of unknown function (DUF2807).
MNRILIAAALVSLFSASAFADIVAGNGKIVTEKRSLPSFGSINVGGSGILKVHRGAQKLELTCDSNVLPYITTDVVGGELRIGLKPFTSLINASRIQYEISMPDLNALRFSGSGDAYIDAFSGKRFVCVISGSGGVKADLDYSSIDLSCSGSGGFDATMKARELILRCSGSGEAYLQGAIDAADFDLSGSAAIRARDLAAREASVKMSGSGVVELRAKDKLSATVSGSGRITYWGDPKMDTRTSGSARIERAGE